MLHDELVITKGRKKEQFEVEKKSRRAWPSSAGAVEKGTYLSGRA